MMKHRLIGSFAISLALAVSACSEGNDYLMMEKRELARGIRYDSLFLGLKFGMTQKEFFDHCFQLNREGIVKEGPMNNTVEYKMPDQFPYAGRMNFYPDYDEDNRIYKMRLYFQYDAWAPWNKAEWSDSLLPEVVKLFKKWYGGDFLKIESADRENVHPVYVKVDGNRRIAVFRGDDMKVNAIITDLTAPKAKEETDKKEGPMAQ
jgi:hypothetical protein